MGQSTIIAGAIFVAWVVWITLKGELSVYLGIFGFGVGSTVPSSGTTSATGTGTGASTSGVLGGISQGIGVANAVNNLSNTPGYGGGTPTSPYTFHGSEALGASLLPSVGGNYGGGGDLGTSAFENIGGQAQAGFALSGIGDVGFNV